MLKAIAIIVAITLISCSGGSNSVQPTGRPQLPQERLLGYDWLAAQHPLFNLGAAIEELPGEGNAVGILDFTFGESLEPVRLILASGKVSHLRVHFINGPCVRNGNCGRYELGRGRNIKQFNQAILDGEPTIIAPFQERVRKFCALIDEFDEVAFYFSWVLEHNLTENGWLSLNHYGVEACPDKPYTIVSNPVDSNIGFPANIAPGVLHEEHGPFASSLISSLDGKDILEIDIEGWLDRTSSQAITFKWTHAYNCRVPRGVFVDPRMRVNCPSREEHKRIINIGE